MDGFEEVDYEGQPMLVCQRPKCGFNTFDAEVAAGHLDLHAAEEADAKIRADLETSLEPEPPASPAPEPKPKPKRKAKETTTDGA